MDSFRRGTHRTAYTSLSGGRGRSGPIGFRPGSHVPVYDDRELERNLPTIRTDGDVTDGLANGLPGSPGRDALWAEGVDYYAAHNRKAHRTSEYETEGLIVRRGQPFSVALLFNRAVDPQRDRLSLVFKVGPKPRPSKGTLLRVPVSGTGGGGSRDHAEHAHTAPEWSAKLVSANRDSAEVQITSPPDAIVGRYEVFVAAATTLQDGSLSKQQNYKHDEPFVVLFNPWCKGDQVFMDSEDGRHEYVLNETGRIYVGTPKKLKGRPWNFGQFEDVSLQAALLALENSSLAKQAHGNPTRICRALSAMANSCDHEGGILTGNWSGNYSGGRAPTSWSGSVDILREYVEKKRPVKYAQCWVFSGVLTTLGRTLGIPTRSITNFESAHDTDTSLTIDKFFSSDGHELPALGGDSVWNYHVWNESWFERPDLPQGYGGWQAFDATPQEASEGIMRCGPAPVQAVKLGHVFLGYDTKFIFAEVNGDKLFWLVENDDIVPCELDRQSVGKSISTKAIGSSQREDITHQYKFPEGTGEEFDAMQKASAYSSKRDITHLYKKVTAHDVQCKFDSDSTPTGDVEMTLDVTSMALERRTLSVFMHCNAKYYTGIPGEALGSFERKVVVEAGEREVVRFTLKATDYMRKLDGDAMVGVSCLVRAQETQQVFTAQDKVSVDLPDLHIQTAKEVRAGDSFQVEVSFTNRLPVSLSDVVVFVEGPGLSKTAKLNLRRVLRAGDEFSEPLEVEMRRSAEGPRELIACMTSKQLAPITGTAVVRVRGQSGGRGGSQAPPTRRVTSSQGGASASPGRGTYGGSFAGNVEDSAYNTPSRSRGSGYAGGSWGASGGGGAYNSAGSSPTTDAWGYRSSGGGAYNSPPTSPGTAGGTRPSPPARRLSGRTTAV